MRRVVSNRVIALATALLALGTAVPAGGEIVLTDPGTRIYYDTALSAAGEVKVGKLASVVGNVHGNAKVSLADGSVVEGDVAAVADLDLKGTVDGTVTHPAAPRKLPLLLTKSEARALADRVFEGDHDFVDEIVDDVVFVAGKARFFGTLEGEGTVIAVGDVEVTKVLEGQGPGLLAADSRLSLVSFNSVKVLDYRSVRGALYAGTDVVLAKGTSLEGTAVANGKLDMGEGVRVQFLDLDQTPPSLVAPSPQANTWVATATPAITASFVDDLSGVVASSVRVLLDGDEIAPDSVSATGFTFTPAAALAEEFHTVDVRFADVAGNEGSGRWFFGVDITAPLLGFVEPGEDIVSGVEDLGVTLSHLDPSSGLATATVEVSFDGEPADCSTAGQLTSCGVGGIDSGDHVLVARAADRVGNVAEISYPFRFRLDSTAPEIEILSPAEGSLLGERTVTISGTVTDDVGVAALSVGGVAVARDGGSFATEVVLEEGLQEVVVSAVDLLGRTAEALIALTVDTVAPGIIVDRPVTGSVVNDAELEVLGRLADEGGIDRVEVAGEAAVVEGGVFSALVHLVEGSNSLDVRAFDLAGNTATATLDVSLFSTPTVRIDSPSDLSYVAATTVDVSGEVGTGSVSVEVNGVAAQLDGTRFVAEDVPLIEGGNVLTATARNADGHLGTSSVNVVRDLSPPHLSIVTPEEGARVFVDHVSVSGMVNDIVAGTVNAAEATVTVNGLPAVVANRSFVVDAVPLQEGDNLLTVIAVDAAGNRAQGSVRIVRTAPDRPWLELVSGDRQTGVVGEALAESSTVVARDAAGLPVAEQTVLFKVRGDGRFDDGSRRTAVTTGPDGEASVRLTLGSRSGAAAQAVEALAPGFAGPVLFTFDVQAGPPASIVVDAGDQQLGTSGRRLPRPLVAAVIDEGANRLKGVPVRFRVVRGSGSLQGGDQEWSTETDSDGRAIAQLGLGTEKGVGAHVVEASVLGAPELGIASFTAAAVAAGPAEETAIRGVVLDNTNLPVPGATIRIRGSSVMSSTDDNGRFRLAPAPVGTVDLIVDGSTVERSGTWPDLEFTLTTVPGHENDLGMPIFLLPLDLDTGVFVDETRGGRLTLPDIPGFALEIEPGSATFPGGAKSGLVSVTVVHSDRVPMVPNFGQQPRLIVTIQPAGARFDPPARLTLPNVEGLAPGQVTEFYSFDHDLGHFVSIGPGTVSDDGTVIVSNPGVGILKAGWHCGGNPASAGTTHDCPECQKCVDNRCVNDDGKSCDDGDECTVRDRCAGGSCTGDPVRILDVRASLDTPVEDRACVGDAVRFRVDVDHENCEDLEYLWDFDDGTTSTEQNPSHVFEEPGTYVVSVLVTCGNCPKERSGDSLVVEGVEDTSYDLVYMNFIPVPYVLGPPVLYDPFQGCDDGPAMVYSGDGRGFNAGATSYRTRSAVTVIPEEACSPSGVDGTPFKDVKPTKVYAFNALDDGVLDAADDDATGDCDRLHLVATASTGEFSITPQRVSATAVKVRFEGNAKNPLAPISFGITWGFDVVVDSESDQWMIEGGHDCYPAHEAYIDTIPMHQHSPASNGFLEISTCLFPASPNVDAVDEGSLP